MVWAVLQFALPVAAAFADARVERESIGQFAHVEASSTDACRPQHQAECALCQIVSRVAAPATVEGCPEIVATVVAPANTTLASPAAVIRGQLPPARAPPAV